MRDSNRTAFCRCNKYKIGIFYDCLSFFPSRFDQSHSSHSEVLSSIQHLAGFCVRFHDIFLPFVHFSIKNAADISRLVDAELRIAVIFSLVCVYFTSFCPYSSCSVWDAAVFFFFGLVLLFGAANFRFGTVGGGFFIAGINQLVGRFRAFHNRADWCFGTFGAVFSTDIFSVPAASVCPLPDPSVFIYSPQYGSDFLRRELHLSERNRPGSCAADHSCHQIGYSFFVRHFSVFL